MKKLLLLPLFFTAILLAWCSLSQPVQNNETALQEQSKTEQNQKNLNEIQPAPSISWSLERDNLIKRFKLMNDRATTFYMYVFIEWVADPIWYYQVNKVSSVNSQLTNTSQIVDDPFARYWDWWQILPSPAEDWSYWTNWDAVFWFTPEWIYLEHNMKYIVSLTPLQFTKPVNRLAVINDNSNAILEKTKILLK